MGNSRPSQSYLCVYCCSKSLVFCCNIDVWLRPFHLRSVDSSHAATKTWVAHMIHFTWWYSFCFMSSPVVVWKQKCSKCSAPHQAPLTYFLIKILLTKLCCLKSLGAIIYFPAFWFIELNSNQTWLTAGYWTAIWTSSFLWLVMGDLVWMFQAVVFIFLIHGTMGLLWGAINVHSRNLQERFLSRRNWNAILHRTLISCYMFLWQHF